MQGNYLDCLLIGNNQMEVDKYVRDIKKMGMASGAYRDLRLNYYEKNNKIYTFTDKYNEDFGITSEYGYMSNNDIQSATIAYLGTFLNKKGISYEYINSFQEEKEKLKSILSTCNITIIAITTTFYTSVLPILEVIDYIKKYNANTDIVIGGPFIMNLFKTHDKESQTYVLEKLGAEYYINNAQGEKALAELILMKKSKVGLACHIKNLIFKRQDGTYTFNMQEDENNDIEENPVDWSLFNKKRLISIRTAISCPFRCAFCGFPQTAGKYCFATPGRVLQELEQISKFKAIKSVNFLDDTFNVPVDRFKELLINIIDSGIEIKWNSHFRCQYANEKIVSLMKQSGCQGVFLGIESGSQNILNNMAKNSNVEHYYNGIKLLKKYGIMIYASFIIGFPGETEETVMATKEFIEKTEPDFYRAQLWYYDLKTPIHEKRDLFGLKNSQFEWEHNTMNSKEAADWIDYLYLNIKNSVWLPQNNFDYPGLFNLISRGWEIEDIKKYICNFNSIVREQIQESDHVIPNFDFSFD